MDPKEFSNTYLMVTSIFWDPWKSALEDFPTWNQMTWPLPLPEILIFHGKPYLHFIIHLKYSFSVMSCFKAFRWEKNSYKRSLGLKDF